ncbi:hypothetical protein V8C35DRAFT_278619 [Trichoderma chlorosporum]
MDNDMENMADFPEGIDWNSLLAVAEDKPVFPDLGIDNVEEDMGNSPAANYDLSSDMDPNRNSKPGYRWCYPCGDWKKNDENFGQVFTKHLKIHNKDLPCEAEPAERRFCFKLFADNKARNRHYWVSHNQYAKEQGIEDPSCVCEICGTSFSRRDNCVKHVKNFHSDKKADDV